MFYVLSYIGFFVILTVISVIADDGTWKGLKKKLSERLNRRA